jgi:hypothetical protein
LYHICTGRIAIPEATTLCITTVWASGLSNQSHQNTLHFLNAHVHMLDYRSIEHSYGHMSPTSFLLQVIETLEDDTFPVGETIADLGESVTSIMGRHVRLSFLVQP